MSKLGCLTPMKLSAKIAKDRRVVARTVFLTSNDRKISSMAKYILVHGIRVCNEFTPETFGRLTTIGPAFLLPVGNKGEHKPFQVCECLCGQTKAILVPGMKGNKIVSCGCHIRALTAERNRRNALHGLCYTPEYEAWSKMQARCHYAGHKFYADYGGRGIAICDRWLEPNGQGFLNFLADMGPKPSPDLSINRKRNDGNYEPGNCEWTTQKEQMRNTRTNVYITFQGKTQCLSAWAEEYDIKETTLRYRVKSAWDFEKALTLPKQTKKHKE